MLEISPLTHRELQSLYQKYFPGKKIAMCRKNPGTFKHTKPFTLHWLWFCLLGLLAYAVSKEESMCNNWAMPIARVRRVNFSTALLTAKQAVIESLEPVILTPPLWYIRQELFVLELGTWQLHLDTGFHHPKIDLNQNSNTAKLFQDNKFKYSYLKWKNIIAGLM